MYCYYCHLYYYYCYYVTNYYLTFCLSVLSYSCKYFNFSKKHLSQIKVCWIEKFSM